MTPAPGTRSGLELWSGSDVWERNEEAWEARLRAEERERDEDRDEERFASLEAAAGIAMSVVRAYNECFVGGDGSEEHGPCMLQLLGVCEEATGEVDVLTSVLLPADGGVTKVAFTERGALRLLKAWWRWHASAPVVLSTGSGFVPVLCALEGEEATGGSLSWAEVRRCRVRTAQEPGARIRIALPTAASERAALQM